MEYTSLLREFAVGLGVKNLEFDEDSVTRLAADDLVVSFMEIPERQSLLIWAEVATPPPENLEQLYKLLLEAMFMGRATQGASFSCEGEKIFLHRMDELSNLDPDRLAKIVEDFLNLLEKWRSVIESFRADESQSDGTATEMQSSFGFSGPADFMQV